MSCRRGGRRGPARLPAQDRRHLCRSRGWLAIRCQPSFRRRTAEAARHAGRTAAGRGRRPSRANRAPSSHTGRLTCTWTEKARVGFRPAGMPSTTTAAAQCERCRTRNSSLTGLKVTPLDQTSRRARQTRRLAARGCGVRRGLPTPSGAACRWAGRAACPAGRQPYKQARPAGRRAVCLFELATGVTAPCQPPAVATWPCGAHRPPAGTTQSSVAGDTA